MTVFARYGSQADWKRQGSAMVTAGRWALSDVRLRPPYATTQTSTCLAVVASDDRLPDFLTDDVLDDMPCRAFTETTLQILGPSVDITSIGRRSVSPRQPRDGIRPYSLVVVTGQARNMLPDEKIWVVVFGEDAQGNGTGCWSEWCYVSADSDATWRCGVQLGDGHQYRFYAVVADSNPSSDPGRLRSPVVCSAS